MISFHSLHVALKQDYLHFIYFHSFPLLHFKTSKQGYLNPFNSILFYFFPLLKYIPFHSIPNGALACHDINLGCTAFSIGNL